MHSCEISIRVPFLCFATGTKNIWWGLCCKQCKQFVDLDENSILANDTEKQANEITTLTSSGIITPNEARKRLGLPPVDGGDALVIPFTKIEDNTIGGTNENEDKNNVEQENEQESWNKKFFYWVPCR